MIETVHLKHEMIPIGRLIDQVLQDRIRIPADWRSSWTADEIASLLTSVSRGFPIGELVLAEAPDDGSTSAKAGPVPIARRRGPGLTVVDGRSRLTALVGSLCLTDAASYDTRSVDYRMHLDMTTGRFATVVTARGAHEPFWFPAQDLISTNRFNSRMKRLTERVPETATTTPWLATAVETARRLLDHNGPGPTVLDPDPRTPRATP
ncbi:MAG: DUF262 domain-containing protein, partial [Acidobacteria bacterium]|nr:DUF262 domain-containing protein [Acidobacteriota bacterium]